jgi:hypothetical protein
MKKGKNEEFGINEILNFEQDLRKTQKISIFPFESEERFKSHFRVRSVTPSRSPTPSLAQIRLKREILTRPNTMQSPGKSKVNMEKLSRPRRTRHLTEPCKKILEKETRTDRDSFEVRYQPERHVFYHKLLGEVRLPVKSFKLSSKKLRISLPGYTPAVVNPVLQPALHTSPAWPAFQMPVIEIGHFIVRSQSIPILFRKIVSASQHYKSLQLSRFSFGTIKKILPGRPFALRDSKKFMKACKEGEILTVNYLLERNKWIAHVFDYSGLTALHWAVIRNRIDVVKALLAFKVFVDVNDFVRII